MSCESKKLKVLLNWLMKMRMTHDVRPVSVTLADRKDLGLVPSWSILDGENLALSFDN